MTRMLKLGAIATMALAMPAAAAVTFNVGVGSPVNAIPGNNDFQSNLNGAGLYQYTASGATISLSGKATVTFEFLGSESGFNDSFSAAGGTINASENTSFTAWGPIVLGSATYNAGAITDWLFSSSGRGASTFGVGSPEFGIFLPRGIAANGNYSSNVLYLGFDDQITGDDDNHDDMIIRITAEDFGGQGVVPEPESWAMLIAGFGLVGAVSRRRRSAASVTA